MPKALPAKPNLEWLRKAAKHRLVALRANDPATKLTAAQRDIAGEYGFTSWRALKAHIDARSDAPTLPDREDVFGAARTGDVDAVRRAFAAGFDPATADHTDERFTRSPRSGATNQSSCLPATSGQAPLDRKVKCGRFAHSSRRRKLEISRRFARISTSIRT
jgi:hypothetical protein